MIEAPPIYETILWVWHGLFGFVGASEVHGRQHGQVANQSAVHLDGHFQGLVEVVQLVKKSVALSHVAEGHKLVGFHFTQVHIYGFVQLKTFYYCRCKTTILRPTTCISQIRKFVIR